jgi:hypothetical protein
MTTIQTDVNTFSAVTQADDITLIVGPPLISYGQNLVFYCAALCRQSRSHGSLARETAPVLSGFFAGRARTFDVGSEKCFVLPECQD